MRASFVFSEVLTGLRRNVTMTIAMVLTTAISLGMFGGGLLVVRTVDKMKANYLEDVEVTINFTEDVSASDSSCDKHPCDTLRTKLESDSAVESVEFESREDAYERFKQIFEEQPQLVELARPESLPASLHVKLHDPSRGEVIVQEYKGTPGVKSVKDQSDLLEGFFDALNGFRNIAFLLAVVMAFAALLLISNTIQLSAFTRRTEVGIMRLVGATRWYTQLPFLLEAVVAGLIGAVLSVAGLVGMKYAFADRVLATTNGIIPKIELLDILFPVAPVLLVTSVVISAVTGYLTLRVYVRH